MLLVPYTAIQLLIHALGPLQTSPSASSPPPSVPSIVVWAEFIGAISAIITPIIAATAWIGRQMTRSIKSLVENSVTSKLTAINDRLDQLTATSKLSGARSDVMETKINSLDDQFKEMSERMGAMERQLSSIQDQLPTIKQAAQKAAGKRAN